MKKNLFLFAALLIISLQQIAAQNVGIGTTTPTQKLDVAGNVNVSGTIMANGTAGTAGQVLTSTGSGMSWTTLGSSMGYKKCVVFTTAGAGTWTVPPGVTEVMVELWGAGSGGTGYCGGTSGGYARTVQTVAPGNLLVYTVGQGSTSGLTSSPDAGNSNMNFPTGGIIAYGGGGVVTIQNIMFKGTARSGTGSLLYNYYFMPGNMGEANTASFGMTNASTYAEIYSYGRGGAPVGMLNPSSVTGDIIRYENGTAVYTVKGKSFTDAPKVPSAGGPAGFGMNGGWNGADGMIAIWFN